MSELILSFAIGTFLGISFFAIGFVLFQIFVRVVIWIVAALAVLVPLGYRWLTKGR